MNIRRVHSVHSGGFSVYGMPSIVEKLKPELSIPLYYIWIFSITKSHLSIPEIELERPIHSHIAIHNDAFKCNSWTN